MKEPVVAVRAVGVSKRYAKVTALDDVSVAISAGRFTAVLGPSGSGKSTLLHCLAGLDTYVTKAISGPELCEAVRRVHDGDAYFSARLAGFVLDAFRGDGPGGLDPELDQLTRRERDVLRLIAAGYTCNCNCPTGRSCCAGRSKSGCD